MNVGKTRTISNNSNVSDVDGLGLSIDANNFDLAEFITKDDIGINSINKDSGSINAIYLQPSTVQVTSSKHGDECDSDSDIIVDIETVENDENAGLKPITELLNPRLAAEFPNEDDNAYVDNIKADPSWSPPYNGKKLEPPSKEVKKYVHTSYN